MIGEGRREKAVIKMNGNIFFNCNYLGVRSQELESRIDRWFRLAA
jgi:hypothetical protein